jgi:hypothetical protein
MKAFVKRHNLILDELEQCKKELTWYRAYARYIDSIHYEVHNKATEWADIDKMINEM